ncbi:uncharacterized protein PV09_09175 [Verruconis gallopava]|uniref:Prokaryotic-type class I peptide chain release factors domain-containing protein n=1 Tax=Verruconis gallopava TaxID=253628 RepID=A0A0D1XAC8_9PEZI|nr:uncharacterized protein PV09_09175 [Verruconis gallopava]KIV99145.1 hypothetical protein PV09_09175 [Verruconis gallopava]
MTLPLSPAASLRVLLKALSRPTRLCTPSLNALCTFSTSSTWNGGSKSPLPPRTPIPDKDITIAYLKGSGPGGQKINKTNSAVQIKHLPSGIVIKCQETRSRDHNQKLAIRKLQDRLEEMEKGKDSRLGRRQELIRRRKRNAAKRARKKYGTTKAQGTEQCGMEDAAKKPDHAEKEGSIKIEPAEHGAAKAT